MSANEEFIEGPPRDAGDEGMTAEEEALLTVSLDGFEGPIDLLLEMARRQKVDLRRISVLALAEQYLAFVAEAKRLRIDLAADYLVMAAWLAYLKSRLLLPEPPSADEPSGAELADRLAHRLARLEAMRKAAAALDRRALLGEARFPRGAPEAAQRLAETRWRADLAELLRSYARIRTRDAYRPLMVDKRESVMALEDARARLGQLLGGMSVPSWTRLEAFLPAEWLEAPIKRRSAVASSFAAALELARRGELELRQEATFAPLLLRPRAAGEGPGNDAPEGHEGEQGDRA
ncbi:MAG: ScpA family protein [Pseudomonadota bacterium]